MRQELGIDAATSLVLFAGRLCPQEQPQVLAQTLRMLRDRGENFIAIVAGDGVELAWLRRFVKRHRLSGRVRLEGALPAAQVHDLMQAADVVFLPSRWEGIALVAYEAMASGVPFVGADTGGQRKLVTPGCGVLIQPDTPAREAVRYVHELSGLFRDPARREALGRAARARVETTYALEAMRTNLIAQLDAVGGRLRAQPHPDACREAAAGSVRHAVTMLSQRDALLRWTHSSRPMGWAHAGTCARAFTAGCIGGTSRCSTGTCGVAGRGHIRFVTWLAGCCCAWSVIRE